MRSSGRPVPAAFLAAALVGGLLLAVPGTAAAAQDPNSALLSPTRWLGTDSRTPFRATTTGDARVGSWRDESGLHHIGKSYFTFDLSRLQGTTVFTATLTTHETSVNDCAKPRAVELWSTDPRGTITWAFQPRELVKAPGPAAGAPCANPWLSWDLGEIVKGAVAEGRTSLTLVARIARDFQGDVAYGRSLSTRPELNVTFNSPPGTPTDLRVGNQSCAEPIVTSSRRPRVAAVVSDPDGTRGLEARMAFWPVDAPDQRVEHTASGDGGVIGGYFPEDMVQDGRQFAFAARTEDGHATSEWTAPCVITADFTAPANAPTVTSTVYREDAGPPGDGGEGIPGDFTFSGDGDPDVVAFDYEGIGIGGARVAADRPGGSATITVTPTTDGPVSVEVVGVDRAGNRSPLRSYRYWVGTTAPRVRMPIFEVGVPRDIVFTATQQGATAFWYTMDDGEAQQVAVGPDGTARATFTFYAAENDRHVLKVWTVNGTGFRSGITDRDFYVVQYEPTVYVDRYDLVVGEKVVVVAEPFYEREGVHAYVFQVGDEPEVVVPVGADGSARYEYTTTRTGFHRVRAASLNRSSVRSGWGEDYFTVTAPGPVVSSTDYPSGRESGGPGVPGTFTFAPSPRLPVAEYRYEFSDGQQGKVPAGPDGRVSVRWTPKAPGFQWVRVTGVTATGVETERGSYSFPVKSSPPTLTSPQYPEGGPSTGRVGQPIEFVATPNVAGSHEVVWSARFGAEQVVPVGADGTARFTYTPTSQGNLDIAVSSRTPDGTVSGTGYRSFYVSP
ncbi:RHS repeat domain-containing protein [Saccharothrix variisporea]|uniref:DNRLRE domain-containing protein n=1 Tax=Saccharothrix variisporea TaxID=543527 RepID=A0A495X5N4_9PSEU|nr:hypothetical protein [Saccharothrix variisporea]RKT68839.1 hypothetical protein DFJ66_2032 [Saccharothrix variisporea]